jgi:aspartate/tyrosine/aromatic aminotransferase
MKTRFNNLPLIKPDPLFETFRKFKEEKNPDKIDLSLGMIQDELGNKLVFECVKKADDFLIKEEMNKEYPNITGSPQYCETIKNLFFDKDNIAYKEDRILVTQPITGGASLRIVSELIKQYFPKKIHTSELLFDPYIQIFQGLEICLHPYFDVQNKELDFDDMINYFEKLEEKSIVLFQLSSHNPTALDISNSQWDKICEIFKKKKFLTVFDSAYLGYATGSFKGDLYPIKKFTENYLEIIVCYSSAKNFTNYSDDVGGLLIVSNKKELLPKLKSIIIFLARSLFSFPSLYGSRIITQVVNDKDLNKLWLEEQRKVYERIVNNRKMIIQTMKENKINFDYEFLERQRGIYMFLDLNDEQISVLVNECYVFLSKRGRINLTGINKDNINHLVSSLKKILN